MINKSKNKIKSRGELIFYMALLFLPLCYVAIFYFGVNATSFVLAFQKYDAETFSFKFNGFETLKTAFSNMFLQKESIWKSAFGLSVLTYLLGVLINTPICILFANFIYKNKRFSGVFKFILFFPSMISLMANIIIYTNFLDGAILTFINKYIGEAVGFFNDTQTKAFISIYVYGFFTGFGSGLFLYVNAMNDIPVSVTEALKMDGCGPMKEFVYVTFPMIFSTWKTLFTIGILSIFGNQMLCVEIYGYYPYFTDMQTVGYYLFRECMVGGESAYPILSAYGIILTLIIVPVELIMKKVMDKLDPMCA